MKTFIWQTRNIFSILLVQRRGSSVVAGCGHSVWWQNWRASFSDFLPRASIITDYLPRVMSQARTPIWCFDFDVHVAAMSTQGDVCDLFKEILNDAKARNEIRGLEQSSFSYDLPEDGLARISGNLHTNNRFLLTESAVKPWISDDQIKMDSGFSDFFLTKMGLEAAFAHQRHLGRLRRWLPSPPGLGWQQLGHDR